LTLSTEGRGLLRLQLVLGGIGAIVWYAGVFLESDFASGIGVGVLASALALRLLRTRS
jgi:hypothetical protein